MSRPRAAGTRISRGPDIARLSAALARPGMDTRSWVEYGTVASVGGDDGVPNFEDPNAIVIDENGVEVDVVIGVDEHPVTCRWGITAGDAFVIPPIFPGDHVMVLIPGGDLGNVPEIVKILPGPHTPLPLDPADRKPLFRNDRLLIFTKTTPIDLRTAGGARVVLDQDGNVVANQGTKGVARLEDTTKLTLTPEDVGALAAVLLATGMFVPTFSPPAPAGPIVFTEGEITSASETVKAG